ncbi:aldehyde dehydrogenase [Apiospora arundinis]|uniref:aldehyde dehydrogenase (NAD(+)) n=1 Tax=Apiospora arundinis TaxID=335852 RepID=A0ABR2IIJ2_9PEZI
MSDTEITLTAPNGMKISLPTGLFINNQFVKGSSSETLTSIDPSTEEPICSVEVATEADVEKAVQAARAAFNNPAWRDLTPEQRAKLLHKAADLVEQHMEELFTLQALDVGKPYPSSMHGEGPHTVGCLRYYAGWANKLHGQTIPVSKDKFGYTLRQPLGVCGAISPWNFPITNAAWKLGPALATGNCVILKPSEYSPLSPLYLAKLFREAGYPPGVVQVINGHGKSTGEALVAHPGVEKIAFTGSTATGRHILQAAGAQMKKTSIEAGGKSAFLVFADANLEQAAKWAIAGGFGNAGQICSANSRILVQRGVQEQFLEIFERMAKASKIGRPFDAATTQGPQASRMQYDKIMGYIESANRDGAELVLGGGRFEDLGDKGYFIQPTIYKGVTRDMKIFHEEIFGPVLAVTAFDTEDEAVALANDSTYGLAAMVFTENIKVAHRTAARLQSGMVYINESNNVDWKLAFRGSKQSGLGTELGESGLDAYLEDKVIHVNLGLEI